MPIFPRVTQGRVDQNLTNVLLAYKNARFYADLIFPTVGGLKDDSGLIPKMGKSHLRQFAAKRGLWDETEHRISFEIDSSDRYAIDYFDLDSYLPDRLIKQWKLPFDAHNAAQMTLIDSLKLSRDIAVAEILTNKAVITNNQDFTSTATRRYDNAASTPLKDIEDAIDGVRLKTGRPANALTIEKSVANALRRHADFKNLAIARLNGGATVAEALSESGLIALLKGQFEGLEYVTILDNVKMTTKKGQTEVLGAVWNPDIVAYYRPSVPALMTPSFGYSFQLDGEVLRTVIRREPKSDKGDLVEVDWAYQDKIVDADAAYLLKKCV